MFDRWCEGVSNQWGIDFNEAGLMPGDVTVAIDYSSVHYKDALAVTGRTVVEVNR